MFEVKARVCGGMAVTAALLALVPAAQAADVRQQISQALADGDGATAATLIKSRNYQGEPQVLGDLIYDAGAIAVEQGTGDPFSDAVPVAFLGARVPYGVANLAFAGGGRTAVVRGLTPEQGRVGGTAVAKTNAAYITSGAAFTNPLGGRIGVGPIGG